MLDRIERGVLLRTTIHRDASHELRTPLAAMQVILGFLRDGDRPLADYQHKLLPIFSVETDRLRALVEDLMLSRPGRKSLHPVP